MAEIVAPYPTVSAICSLFYDLLFLFFTQPAYYPIRKGQFHLSNGLFANIVIYMPCTPTLTFNSVDGIRDISNLAKSRYADCDCLFVVFVIRFLLQPYLHTRLKVIMSISVVCSGDQLMPSKVSKLLLCFSDTYRLSISVTESIRS